jgi:hypothetical protein
MAVKVYERPASGAGGFGGSNGRKDLEFVAIADAGEDDGLVEAAILEATPDAYGGLNRLQPIYLQPVDRDAGIYYCTVSYVTNMVLSSGRPKIKFKIGGGTQTVRVSKETVNTFAPTGKTAPDYKQAINVTGTAGNFSVEGTDVPVQSFEWEETWLIPTVKVTDNYLSALTVLVSNYNDAPWRDFASGTVTFLGAEGGDEEGANTSITFAFRFSPNVLTDADGSGGLTIGEITGVYKLGAHYLWVRYDETEDATAKAPVVKPIGAYVERLTDPGDFRLLGIGGGAAGDSLGAYYANGIGG